MIELAPTTNHKDIMEQLNDGKELAPDDLANPSKIKAKLEIIGDYADMEKVRDLLKKLAASNSVC
jgi:hypothetical protein